MLEKMNKYLFLNAISYRSRVRVQVIPIAYIYVRVLLPMSFLSCKRHSQSL